MSFLDRIGSLNRGPRNRPPFEAFYIYALALFAGYLISDLGVLAVRPGMLPTEAPPMRPSSAPKAAITNVAQYQKIKDRNVFNLDGKIPPALTADGQESTTLDAPPVASTLPLKLEGTLVHSNPKRSVATIKPNTKNEAKAYMVDEEIEGLARVTKIERRKVIFRNLNSQRLEFIEIPKDSTVTFGVKDVTVGNEDVQHKGEFSFSMRRSDINKYTSDLGSILQQARMVPNIVPGSGGRVDGFRFVAIQPGSIYEKLGFKADDVIRQVNGEPVNSPTKAMELYNALRTGSNISILINRNNQDTNFNYDISD